MAAFSRVGVPLLFVAALLMRAAAYSVEAEVEAEKKHAVEPSVIPIINLADAAEGSLMLAPVVIYNFHEKPLTFDIGPQKSSEKLFAPDQQLLPFRKDRRATLNSGSRFVINAVLRVSGSTAASFSAEDGVDAAAFELTTGYVSVSTPGANGVDMEKLGSPPAAAPEADVSAEDTPNHYHSSTTIGEIDPTKGTAFFGVVIYGGSSTLYDIHGYLCDDNMAFTWRSFQDDECPRISAASGHMWGDCWAIAFCSMTALRESGQDNCFEVPQAKLAHLALP